MSFGRHAFRMSPRSERRYIGVSAMMQPYLLQRLAGAVCLGLSLQSLCFRLHRSLRRKNHDSA